MFKDFTFLLKSSNYNKRLFFVTKNNFFSTQHFHYSAHKMSNSVDISNFLSTIAPPLDGSLYKGQSGRIGVLGGSKDYTGAPYYAGMAALRTGAELLYLFTADEAAIPIKSYSPELMVTPVYGQNYGLDNNQQSMVQAVTSLFPRLHSLVIGPGLGRDANVLSGVAQIIQKAKEQNLPIVIDADGMWLVTMQPDIVQGYKNAILTPNKIEYERLKEKVLGNNNNNVNNEKEELKQLCISLGNITIVKKGKEDLISNGINTFVCDQLGTPRRCGGLGDILSGTIGTIQGWINMKGIDKKVLNYNKDDLQLLACLSSCYLVRTTSFKAFEKHKRSMTAPDVLNLIGDTFEQICPTTISKM
eukprot:c18724_g2_i1.p1 GENE.c18724_g2_i1~~c18724_g2_i1.p1  ORF type:complete len:358 (+),score=119.47 c18724_g2_i1:3-1076(+)